MREKSADIFIFAHLLFNELKNRSYPRSSQWINSLARTYSRSEKSGMTIGAVLKRESTNVDYGAADAKKAP
ncbi:hypothetical protein, partial [Serratia marcescens]|uniref:hypothetical protein n=1 Tax=Serratia marcescens TaxID=615 RepID=UPI001A91501C